MTVDACVINIQYLHVCISLHITQAQGQVLRWHFNVDHSCQNCVLPSKIVIDILGQLSLPPYTPSAHPPCPLLLRHTTERACVYQDPRAQRP